MVKIVRHWVVNRNWPEVVNGTGASTKLDIPQSNSMAENANYIFKHSNLKGHIPDNDEELTTILNNFLEDFNHHRYPLHLYGYTPIEVLREAVPGQNRFKELIEQVRKNRPIENRFS